MNPKNPKKANKILITMLIVTALTLTSVTQLLPVQALDVSDGPTITIGDPSYEGMAPPISYEGSLCDYDGPLEDAIWVNYTTPINISVMGYDDYGAGSSRLWYRVWWFGDGWISSAGYGNGWVPTSDEFVEITMEDFGTDHPCWHKVESYYINETGVESEHTSIWFYLDPDPPATSIEFEDYCDDGLGGICINANSTVYLDACETWNIEDYSCPTGVNYTMYNITHVASGNYTGWILYDGSVNLSLLEEDCEHQIEYYSVDNFGYEELPHNVATFYFDNTPHSIVSYDATATYEEDVNANYPDRQPLYKAKNETGGCVNITVTIDPSADCCGNESAIVKLLVTRPDPEAQEGYVDIMVYMNQLGTTNTYYFNWCNDDVIDIRCNNLMEDNTLYPGTYYFDIIVEDCLGNQNITSDYFLIKPLCDVDIIELLEPDPSIWHPEMPTAVKAVIKNNGILPVDGPVNVHLQIYEETEVPLTDYYCFDMEECIVSGMWETISWDDGPSFDTWTWTEKRSHSPTHSWHSQPDSIENYEAYSRDSLILANGTQGLYIPEEVEYQGKTYQVLLDFWHWCEGEAHGGVPLDFGQVKIRYWTGSAWSTWRAPSSAAKYYNTNGEWEHVQLDITGWLGYDDAPINRDPTILGKWIQVNWTWVSDATDNREGWYIDDVCIKLRTGSPQPLVFQGYKYVYDLDQNETKVIEFPLNFTPKPDTWYYFEIYSDLQCCQYQGDCLGDYDGPADVNGEWVMDPRTKTEYWDPYNGVNHSLYFGDVCDAAINYVKAPSDLLLDHTSFEGYVSVPIEVEVENTGTLTEEVPVTVKVQEALTNVIFFDDVESGELDGWGAPGMWVAGEELYENQWTITDDDYYSPVHSWFLEPREEGIGQAKMWGPIEKPYDIPGGLKWEANIKFNLPPGYNYGIGAMPVMLGTNYFWDFGISIDANYETDEDPDYDVDRVYPWNGQTGWFHFDADEFIRTHDLYWEERYNPSNYPEYEPFFNDSGGFDSLDDFLDFMKYRYEDQLGSENFDEMTFGFLVAAPDGLESDQGFWFDDFKLYNQYAGAVVWQETKIAKGAKESDGTYDGLEQGEKEILEFTWNATEYCDYIITAEVDLDCDADASNNMDQTSTRIHEHIYEVGEYEKIMFEDNTCKEDNNWHIVEECSLCPDDQFWWCGDDATGLYAPNSNDVLMINHTFNMTDALSATLTFDEYYAIEDEYDYGYVEVSNNSGEHWFVIRFKSASATGVSEDSAGLPEWATTSLLLEPGAVLESEYTGTGFAQPATFFTDEMQFRFRFYSDESAEWKGWYINDVVLDMTTATGTETLFEDDMEDIDSSLENWTTMGACIGNHWHNESTFGDGTDAPWWWNGEYRYWEVLGLGAGFEWPETQAWPAIADWPDFVTFEDNAGDGEINTRYTFGGPEHMLSFNSGSKPDQEDDWWNVTIQLPVSSYIELQVPVWFWRDTANYADGTEIWIGVTDGTDTLYFGGPPGSGYTYNDALSYCVFPGVGMIYPDVIAGGGGFFSIWAPYVFDISIFSGQEITFFVHWNMDVANHWTGFTSEYPFQITAMTPGSQSIPYQQYYPNVDEKVIYEYDLTKAFEAILHFDQNYSFADANDLGYVEISTDGGETWQPILVNRGSSGGWIPVTLDISKYAGGDVPVQIRWRFVSDGSGQDYGWMFDNMWIDGKVDYKAPTVTHTLNPATPNGNNDWYTTDVTVTLTASDNIKVDTIKYRIDGGSWLTYTAPFTIGIEGQHTIDYYAIDSVGNAGDTGSVTFKIDKTKPTASINVPQSGYIYFFGRELMPRLIFKDKALIIGGLTAEASASDATSGVYVVKFNEDGTTFGEDTTSPYTAQLPFSLFQAHELTVTAEDRAGNTYTTSAVPYFKIF